MHNGAKIGMIVLLVLAVVLGASGVTGLVLEGRERAAQPTEYQMYQSELEEITQECEGYQAIAEQSLINIQGYIDQMEKNRAAVAAAGGSTADVDKALETVKKALSDAESTRDKIVSNVEKVKAFAGIAESDAAGVANARNMMPKRRNSIVIDLKKITKIDADESASNPSFETIARKQCETATAAIQAANPDVDLGEQFVVTKEAAEAADEVMADRGSLTEYLKKNWQYCFWLAGFAVLAAVLCALGWKKPETLKKLSANANKNMMLVALVFITLIFFIMTEYKILTPVNVSNIINQNAYIIILACGMLLCIVCSANIDLSVGRVMGFIAACAAKFMIEGKMSTWVAVPLCLLIGMAIGAWQGFWIAYMKIPAFIVTLAGQLTFYGLTMMILQGLTINNFPPQFSAMFNSYLPDYVGTAMNLNWGINVTTMLIGVLAVVVFILIQLNNRRTRIKKGYGVETIRAMLVRIVIISVVLLWLFYSMAAASGLPTVLFTVAIVLLIYLFITSKTVMGRHLYAMGGNVNAARLSGVKTQKMLFLAYVNMGLLAALAGLVYAARLNAASPQAGQGDELYAIASCYIGGASAYGGIGTIGGALIGAMTMGVIKNGMSIMSLGQDIQQIVLGMVLLVAVVIDVVSKSNGTALPFLSRLGGKKEKKAG